MEFFRYIIIVLFVPGIFPEKTNLTRLELGNRNLLTIKRQTFENYPKLEELNVANSQLTSIEEGAFHDLLHLKEVNVSYNFITSLRPEIFRPGSELCKLVASHNMLSNIDSFNSTYFPALTLLDVSNNQIRSLPLSFVDKLQEDPNFTLIASDNPLDCENGKWSCCLNKEEKFCKLPQPAALLRVPTQASFLTCLFWNIAAFWLGIIAGNVCIIKRIVFPKKALIRIEKSTQYDTHNDVIRTECKLQNINPKISEKECYVQVF